VGALPARRASDEVVHCRSERGAWPRCGGSAGGGEGFGDRCEGPGPSPAVERVSQSVAAAARLTTPPSNPRAPTPIAGRPHFWHQQDAPVLRHPQPPVALQQRLLLLRGQDARAQLVGVQQGVVRADLAVLLAVEDVDLCGWVGGWGRERQDVGGVGCAGLLHEVHSATASRLSTKQRAPPAGAWAWRRPRTAPSRPPPPRAARRCTWRAGGRR